MRCCQATSFSTVPASEEVACRRGALDWRTHALWRSGCGHHEWHDRPVAPSQFGHSSGGAPSSAPPGRGFVRRRALPARPARATASARSRSATPACSMRAAQYIEFAHPRRRQGRSGVGKATGRPLQRPRLAQQEASKQNGEQNRAGKTGRGEEGGVDGAAGHAAAMLSGAVRAPAPTEDVQFAPRSVRAGGRELEHLLGLADQPRLHHLRSDRGKEVRAIRAG